MGRVALSPVQVQRLGSKDCAIVPAGDSLDDKALKDAGFEPLSDEQFARLERLGAASKGKGGNTGSHAAKGKYDALSPEDLADLASEREDIDVDKIEGSGKDGNVLKADWIAALEAADAAADNGGPGGDGD